MTTKLKIDLTQGILEVEGSETFVKTIYRDFKAQFIQGESSEEALEPPRKRRRTRKPSVKPKSTDGKAPSASAAEPAAAPEKTAAQPTAPETPAAKMATPVPTYARIKGLDLGATGEHSSLVEFMDAKLPITNEERNLVFLYYLQHVINLKSISMDHVYTCYREVNIRAPLNLEHSLSTTANQKGWINLDDSGQMAVTSEGKNYVEKQLPKKVKG